MEVKFRMVHPPGIDCGSVVDLKLGTPGFNQNKKGYKDVKQAVGYKRKPHLKFDPSLHRACASSECPR